MLGTHGATGNAGALSGSESEKLQADFFRSAEDLAGTVMLRSPSPQGLCFFFKGTQDFGHLSLEMIQKHYAEQKWAVDRHLSWEDVELVISEMKRAQASASQQLAIEDNIPFDVVSCVGIMETEDVETFFQKMDNNWQELKSSNIPAHLKSKDRHEYAAITHKTGMISL